MTYTILVPLDGSPLAERAVPLAVRLANASSARLVLARVLPREAASVELAASEVRTYLDHTADTLREQGATVETATGCGKAAAEILRIAHEYSAELVVMSTHGRSGPGRWLYGSVADEVLRHSDVPVMLLPPDAKADFSTERAPRVLVPLDGSSLGEAALGPARDWAARLGAELILLRASQWPPLLYAEDADLTMVDPSEQQQLAQEYLDDVAARWPSDTAPIRTRAVLAQQITTQIAQVAAEEGVDFIAMATHGRSGVARMVLGSVATGTLQRAAVPVLIVRPAELAAAAAA